MKNSGFKFRSNDFFKSPVDIVLSIIFILYIILPIQFPEPVNNFLISPFGLFFILTLMVIFFIYGSVIVGVLFIFVAFLIVHRISKGAPAYETSSLPTQPRRDREIEMMNPPVGEVTLEEEIVIKTVTPIMSNSMENFMETSFKPVYCDTKTEYTTYAN